MKDGGEFFGGVDLGRVETVHEAADTPAVVRAEFFVNETLSVDEKEIADKLVAMLEQYLSGLNLATKLFPKILVVRLIEKLQAAHLPEESVGNIAEGVWMRLKAVNGGRDGLIDGVPMTAEGQIVQDIMAHVDGSLALLVKGYIDSMVAVIGPATSGKIIRTVAREAWPSVRKRLKV